MKKKALTYYIHYNKPGSSKGTPWTVHSSKGCLQVAEVFVRSESQTIFKPTKKTNPKGFIKTRGILVMLPGNRVVIKPS